MVVTSLSLLGQGETGSDFSKLFKTQITPLEGKGHFMDTKNP